MTEIFGKHRQDYDDVRRLCLICHGLDLTSSMLFSNSTYKCASENTKRIFQNLVSGSLLNLAVAIRINIYQGKILGSEYSRLLHCGSYYEDRELICKEFTIKDVCDKIIHAHTMSKEAIPPKILGDSKMTMQFKGERNSKSWTMDLSVELFTEAVLNFLDELEKEAA
jgi:hypothetical protein